MPREGARYRTALMSLRPTQRQLVDAVANLVAESDWVTFVQISEFLERRGIRTKGRMNLSLASDQNVLLWSGMSRPMCDVLLALMDEKRIFAHRASVTAYHVHGGVLSLPLADAPRARGLAQPHWLPVAFRVMPPTWALH